MDRRKLLKTLAGAAAASVAMPALDLLAIPDPITIHKASFPGNGKIVWTAQKGFADLRKGDLFYMDVVEFEGGKVIEQIYGIATIDSFPNPQPGKPKQLAIELDWYLDEQEALLSKVARDAEKQVVEILTNHPSPGEPIFSV